MLTRGQQLNKFTILEQLGSGGMGEVYLAEDSQLHRQVAIKILHAELFGDKERLDRFYREARTAAQITHANVMAIYDLETAKSDSGEEVTFIVMEYVRGESLTSWLGKSGGDLNAVIRIAEKIASGLAAAHKMNIVHRDIKSENIIITESGEPKILDFGLAKGIDSDMMTQRGADVRTVSRELTRAGKILGTVSYMSPEQARGEVLDARSDIFSFGILLYRMLTGDFPFAGATDVSTLAKILEVPHESARIRNSAIPPELERIIDKCLRKEPADRYQSTQDLVVDLRNLRRQVDSGVTQSYSKPVDAQPKRTIVMNLGWKAGVSVAATVALIALAVYWLWSSDEEIVPSLTAGEGGLAIIGFENKTGDTSLNWMSAGLPEILLTDLAQNPQLRLISDQRLQDALNSNDAHVSHDDYVAAARKLGVSQMLSGSYFKMGDQVRIDARIEDVASGQITSAHKVLGRDPFGLVDSLSQKISSAMNISTQSDVSASSILSSSPEAYKHYLAGMKHFNNSDFDNATPEFLTAISDDSTFALPYMRLGMANAYQGRMKPAGDYLTLAITWQHKLPVRERALLDVYADAWLRRNWRDANTKLESFVNQYPDDKEALAMHGIVVFSFTGDTTKAIQSLNSALKLDADYLAALGGFAQMYLRLKLFDKAIEYAENIRDAAPNTPAGHLLLADLFTRTGKLDASIREYQTVLSLASRTGSALEGLSQIYVYKRQFDSSRYYLERLREEFSNDNAWVRRYYKALANVDNWEGKFASALKKHFKALDYALKSHDSTDIANTYSNIATMFERIEQPDSAVRYAGIGYTYTSNGFGTGINYAFTLSELKPALADSATAIFKIQANELRARLPKTMWGLVDALEELFEGSKARDSSRMIAALRKLDNPSLNPSPENRRELARLLIDHGQSLEGIAQYDSSFASEKYILSGYEYPMYLYYVGKAWEDIGDKAKAQKMYEEMLSYWGEPEYELKEIRDARKRLKRLTKS